MTGNGEAGIVPSVSTERLILEKENQGGNQTKLGKHRRNTCGQEKSGKLSQKEQRGAPEKLPDSERGALGRGVKEQ